MSRRAGATVALTALLASAVTAGVAPSNAAGPQPTTVSGWGGFDVGQSVVPAGLAGRDVVAVSAGDEHSLALTRDGAVTGWGWNGDGQAVPPADLAAGAVRASMIDAGVYSSLAVLTDGSVRGWGALGSTDEGQVDIPAELRGPSPATPVTEVSAGTYHSLAITSTGRVLAWGALNRHADIDGGQTHVPVSLTDGSRFAVEVAAGYLHSVALDSQGRVYAWGTNLQRQREVPAALAGEFVVDVEAHGSASLALTADGEVYGWGDSGTGTLDLPADLTGKRVVAIDLGAEVAMALTSTGEVITWGDTGKNFPLPTIIAQQGPVTGIAAGGRHLLATHPVPAPPVPPVVTPPAATATSLRLTAPPKVVQGKRAKVRVTLTGVARGTIAILDRGRRVAELSGSGSVRLRLKKGRHVLVARYAGTASTLASASTPVTVKVVRKRRR